MVNTVEAKKKKYPNGDYYEGEWKKGAPHGYGIMKYTDGNVYEGNWNIGLKEGKGIMKYAKGNVYDGQWLQDKENGQGTMKFANGDIYEGEWEKGKQQGTGMIRYTNGNIYDGEWEEGKKHGTGTMEYINGDIYNGDWENEKQDGFGIYTYQNKNTYIGYWESGRQTTGKLVVTNGNIYEGEFKDGKLYNGKVKKEIKLYGNCEMNYVEGNLTNIGRIQNSKWEYNGDISDYKPTGKGLITIKEYEESEITQSSFSYNKNNINKYPLSNKTKKGKGTQIILNNKIETSINNNNAYATIEYSNKTREVKQQTLNSHENSIYFWFDSLLKDIKEKEKNIQDDERLRPRIEQAKAKGDIIRQQAEIKRKEEEKKRQEEEQRWAQVPNQLPYYIWEPAEIKNIYENNPAKLRSMTQSKNIIFYGTIAEIEENKSVEWNIFLEDYVEYKYYIVRLSGGVYLESRDAGFISNLNTGNTLYLVSYYTDGTSFYRPLFKFRMYAGSTQRLINLMRENGFSLNQFVRR